VSVCHNTDTFFMSKICVTDKLTALKLWHKNGRIPVYKFKNLIINMSVNFKPLADRVLVEPVAAEQKTASGIIIPDTAKEKPLRGTVIAAGTGKKDEPMTVKVGDSILYGQYSGTEIKIDGKNFLIMRESDIYGIF
jgi:chaperonin GroES